MSFAESLDLGMKAAVCGWLSNGGNAVLGAAVLNGLRVPGGQVPSLAAGLGLLALNYGCSFDPGNDGPVPPANVTGCMEAATGYIQLGYVNSTGGFAVPGGRQLRKIESVWKSGATCVTGSTAWSWRTIQTNGARYDVDNQCIPSDHLESRLSSGGTCVGTFPEPGPTGEQPPYTYVDQTTNCEYVVEHLAWDVGSDGVVAPVVKISPGAATHATGGVIGGCNFEPVLYYGPGGGGGGGGGGGPVFPWTPGPDVDGEPWWVPLIRGAAGGVAGAVTSKLLDAIFGEKTPADLYRLVSVCEMDAQGEPVSQTREVTLPAAPILNGIVARLDAMEVLMQGLKDFKQPVCGKKKATGELVTVNFNSHPAEVPSKQQVVKQLRYRDQSGRPESFHVDHWRGFVWQTGPVIVTSRGAAWGVVQVWASTSDEGRRVINHAAAAASVSLGVPEHKWEITSPKDPRYGREATVYPVKFDATGLVMVSKRDGASGSPVWMRDP